MGESIKDRLIHAFDVFTGAENQRLQSFGAGGVSYGVRPHIIRPSVASSKSIISSIYTRIAIDVAAVTIKHVILDEYGRYKQTAKSGLNNCLLVEANLDQAARAFRMDIAMSLFDQGSIAIVPVDTTMDATVSGTFGDIQTMRVGQIVSWAADEVRVSLYNEKTGKREELNLKKKSIAIIENPLYAVMNEPNSTLQRLIHKLSLLDSVDEQASSGKLDLIIQLPYVIKSEARRQQADQRRKDIEEQLKGSQYGIAYTDGTERITQLNRPAENNLLTQVEYLTKKLYGELGLTEDVFNGTANEATMLNYFNRTIEPVLTAITEGMKRSFLTKTARTQGHSIEFFRDPFKLATLGSIAEIADKLTRNEIASSNEIRSFIGLPPSTDAKADQLRNSNMPVKDTPDPPPPAPPDSPPGAPPVDT